MYHVGPFVGSIVVAAPPSLLAGTPTDTAASHIPDQAFPIAEQAEFSPHPTTGLAMSRTRILLTFRPSATVGEVNQALSAANVTILGGMSDVGILLVGAADTPQSVTVFCSASIQVDFGQPTNPVWSLATSPMLTPGCRWHMFSLAVVSVAPPSLTAPGSTVFRARRLAECGT